MVENLYTTFNSKVELSRAVNSNIPLAIMPCKQPIELLNLMTIVVSSKLNITFELEVSSAYQDLKKILEDKLDLHNNSSLNLWLQHMNMAVDMFASIEKLSSVAIRLSTQRVCQKFHVDKVNYRMLVTYFGKGTEWAPITLSDHLLKSNSNFEDLGCKTNFIKPWDIALFKGGSEGFLHRTPVLALQSNSILFKLDNPNFLRRLK